MPSESTRNLLRILGPLWFGFVLVGTIVSAFFAGAREFIASNGIIMHLVYFWLAMIPGLVMVYVAEQGVAE